MPTVDPPKIGQSLLLVQKDCYPPDEVFGGRGGAAALRVTGNDIVMRRRVPPVLGGWIRPWNRHRQRDSLGIAVNGRGR